MGFHEFVDCATHSNDEQELYVQNATNQFTLPKVLKTNLFVATPCEDCDIPGYLVLQPQESRGAFEGLPKIAQEQLGSVLGQLEAAVSHATAAQHVYILRFSEGLPSVHFHIFPRTDKLANLWIQENPTMAHDGINGPLLFAWARIRYHVASPERLSRETLELAAQLRQTLSAAEFQG